MSLTLSLIWEAKPSTRTMRQFDILVIMLMKILAVVEKTVEVPHH